MAEAKIDIILSNGSKAGGTLQDLTKQANSLNKELSKLPVGSAEFVKKSADLQAVSGRIKDVKEQIKGTTEASNFLKQAFNNLPGAQYFNQIGQSFGIVKQGVGGLVSQFGVLRTAIAATGIGLLIVALGTLVAWFKKTDEGATLLSGIMRGIGVVFDTVFGKLIDMFKGLASYFNGEKSIKQGLIDLVDFIGNNLLNRIKSFAVIWEGIVNMDLKTVTDGFIQLGTGIENGTDKMLAFGKAVGEAVKEGIDLEKQLDAIEDRARELSVLNAETEKEVGRLLLQSKNVGLTYEERINLLDRASALELANHRQQLLNAKELEAVRQKEIDDAASRNIQTDELDQALADAQIARINLEKESITLQEKIANRRTALVEKQQTEIEKQAADELKVIQSIAALKAQAQEDGFQQELATIQQQTEEKIATLQGTEAQILEQKLLLKEVEEQQMMALGEKYQAIYSGQFKKNLDEQKKLKDEASAEEKERKQQELEDQRSALSGSLLIAADFFGTLASFQKQGTEQWKAFATTSAIMSTIQGAINAYQSTAAIPIVGPTLAPIAAGLALAAGYQRVREIQNTKVQTPTAKPKARRGMVLRGPTHEQGGIPVEAENEEIIMTSGVYRDPYLRRMASQINVAAGGVSFDGYSKYAGGGVPSQDIQPTQAFDYDKLVRVFDARIDMKIKLIKVQNVAEETKAINDEILMIKNVADV